MDYSSNTAIRIYAGPSLLSKFPVVALAIPAHVDTWVRTSEVGKLLGPTLAGSFIRALSPHDGEIGLSEIASALTRAMLAASGMAELSVTVCKDHEDQSVIIARYYDPSASSYALQAAFDIAKELFSDDGRPTNADERISGWLANAVNRLSYYAPDSIALSLIKIAESRDIPYRVMASYSKTWLFGHGVNSVQFCEAVTANNGVPGIILAKNKVHANRVVRTLGFPATRCGIANSPGAAARIARSLGYPVVVKPVDGGGGQGITANISQDEELEEAFRKAAVGATPAVLVENHVAGDDYRIAIFGGRLAWVIRRVPAQVVGDGKHSIQELIAEENERRKQQKEHQFDLKSIVINDELVRILRKQGYALDDRPAQGVSVRLSSVANISRGGTLENCTAIAHPDNIAMAECVARNFRLDSAGIDFITPDIRKSWRSCPCAIIEVNGMPGLSTLEDAGLVLGRQFADGSDGRISVILALDCEASGLGHIAAELGADREGLGIVTADTCTLDGFARGDSLVALSDKAGALLSDPACAALLIGLTTADIEERGLPVDRCAVTLVSSRGDLPARVDQVIRMASGSVIEVAGFEDFTDKRLGKILSQPKRS